MQTSGLRVWLILWKAYEAMREHARTHAESLELCLSDFGVLEVVLEKGPTPVNAIGEKIRLTSGSITTAVDRLERKGLVERRGGAGGRGGGGGGAPPPGGKRTTSPVQEHEG